MASTYVKLQQAYVSEADSLGTWSLIGYKGPGDGNSIFSETNNFSYVDGFSAKMAIPSADQKGWAQQTF